jgi:hypothetical protein
VGLAWIRYGSWFGEDPRNARGGNGPTRSRDLKQEMLSEGYHVLFLGTRTWYTLPSNRSTELGMRDDRAGGTRLSAVLDLLICSYGKVPLFVFFCDMLVCRSRFVLGAKAVGESCFCHYRA